jgi:hypothetical protein
MFFIFADLKKFLFQQETVPYLYQAKGKFRKITVEYNYNMEADESDHFKHRIFIEFNENGLVSHVRSENDTGTATSMGILQRVVKIIKRGHETDFIYGDHGKVGEEIVQLFEASSKSDFEPVTYKTEYRTYVYDKNGNLRKVFTDNGCQEIYYDSRGRITETINYYENMISGYTEYRYDEFNRVVKKLKFSDYSEDDVEGPYFREPGIKLGYVTEYEYSELNDNETQCIIKTLDLPYDFTDTEVHIYDENLRVKSINKLRKNGSIRDEIVYTYAFDEQGNVVGISIISTYFSDEKNTVRYSNAIRKIEYS